MEKQIQKKYFISDTVPGKWSSVYTYKPLNQDIRTSRGEIFAAVSLQAPPDFASPTAGNLLIDYLHENYFENSKDKALIALEKALINTSKYLVKFLENDKAGDVGIDLNITAMVILEDVTYFVVLGEGHIHVFRDGNLSDLAHALRDPTGEGLVRSGSMVLKRGDVLTLGTAVVSDEISLDELVECSVNFSDTSLRGKGHEKEPNLALMMVGYNIDRREAQEEYSLQQEISALQGKEDEFAELPKGGIPGPNMPEVAIPEAPENAFLGEQEEQDSGLEVVPEEPMPADKEILKEAGQEVDTVTEELTESSEEDWGEPAREGAKSAQEIAKIPVNRGIPSKTKNFVGSLRGRAGAMLGSVKEKIANFRNRRAGQEEFAYDRTAATAGTPVTLTPEQMQKPTFIVLVLKLKNFLVGFFARLKHLVWNDWLGIGRENIYLKGGKVKRNWAFIAILTVVVVGILYFSIKGVITRNELLAKESEARIALDTTGKQIDEVAELSQIVAGSSGNLERKQSLLDKLQQAESSLQSVNTVEKYQQEIQEKLQRISSLRDLLNKIIAVAEPKLVADIGGLYPGAEVTDFVVSKGEIFVTDKKYGKVYRISYSGNNLRDFASGFTGPYSITVDNESNLVVIDVSGDQRVATVNRETGVVSRHIGTSETRVGGIGQIEFSEISGGRLYGVDTNTKTVVALQKTGNAYGIPQKRLDLPEAELIKDISINDMKIYLLGSIKEGIYRTLNAVDDTPKITGLASEDSILNSTAFFIDGQFLYIADPVNKRVLVFPKEVETLDLKAQYLYRGSDSNVFTQIKEVAADRENNKLFVLDGSKIYELDLTKLAGF